MGLPDCAKALNWPRAPKNESVKTATENLQACLDRTAVLVFEFLIIFDAPLDVCVHGNIRKYVVTTYTKLAGQPLFADNQEAVLKVTFPGRQLWA
jgi:hypothetical protein